MSFKEVAAFKQAVKGHEFIVYDTETTGLKADTDEIIEFSGVKVSVKENGGFSIAEELDIFIKQDEPLSEEIVELTGITDDMLNEGLSRDDAFSKIKAFLGDEPIICGYNNVNFDNKFMTALYSAYGAEFKPSSCSIDVMKMAKEKLPKPYKLINVCEKFGISDKYTFHRSIDDARATLGCLLKLMPMYKEEDAALTVTGAQRWNKHGYDRIYVTNTQKASIFYDVESGAWNILGDYDEKVVKKQLFSLMGVANETELVQKVA